MLILLDFKLVSVFSMLSSLWHVSLSIAFAYLKCRSPFSLHIVNIIFTNVSCCTMCTSSFWWFQGHIFMKMSWSYHVNTFCTHSQSFKNFHISVVMVVVKCIFSVKLVVKSSQSCHIDGHMLLTCFG